MGMSEEEARQFREMLDGQKSLTERLAAAEAKAASEETARKTAESEAKHAVERVTALERTATRKSLSEHVRSNRLAYQGEVDEAVDRLEKLAVKLGQEDFGQYMDEKALIHAQLKESALFTQIGSNNVRGSGPEGEMEALIQKCMNEQKLDRAAATVKIASENPVLYKRYDEAQLQRQARRGGE